MKNYLASLVLAVCLLTGPVASQSATVSINIGGTFLCMNVWLLHFADARKCYICGEGADGPFRTLPTHHGQSSVPTVEGTCEGFRPEEKYAFDCPPSYTSCLTQVDGEIEIRTCGENLAINDCKSANNIDYCYCSTDLCNRLTRTEIRRSIESALMHAHNRNRLAGVGMHHHPPPNNSDDEDMAESSGMDGDRSESHRTISSSRSSTQQHHRDMLHNGAAAGGDSIVAPGHRDVTTQITITLKPVATSTDRRSKDNSATSDSNTTAHHDRSRDSNAIPSTSSSSSSLRVGPPLIVLALLLATLKHVPY